MTNVPATGTDLSGDLGVSPGTLITGFSPTTGHVHGATHAGDTEAAAAQAALGTAYDDAAGRTGGADAGAAIAGATTLGPGVYHAAAALDVGGTLTLDGQGNRNAVFIFQVGSQLTVDTSTHINMIGLAQQCNVFWQVGTLAAVNANVQFVGTIMALAQITVGNATTVAGRALARNADVTLDNNVFTAPTCALTGGSGGGGGGTTSAAPAGGAAASSSAAAAAAASSSAAASRAAASRASAAAASSSRARFATSQLANTGVSPVLKPMALAAVLLLILGCGLLSVGRIRNRHGTRQH